jgi:hypothetical protein
MLPPKMTDADGTLLWTSPEGLRCLLVPFFGHCQLRLLRNLHIVKTAVFDDEPSAVAAAKEWQRKYGPSARSRARTARARARRLLRGR